MKLLSQQLHFNIATVKNTASAEYRKAGNIILGKNFLSNSLFLAVSATIRLFYNSVFNKLRT